MRNILLFIWQLPQNIIGIIIFIITRAKHESEQGFYCSDRFKYFGVSLGIYIIFGGSPSEDSIKHEKGHQKQSQYLGWFYLPLIGIPSFVGNIRDRLFHKKWSEKKRIAWYYNQYWEKWADNLGGVKREEVL